MPSEYLQTQLSEPLTFHLIPSDSSRDLCARLKLKFHNDLDCHRARASIAIKRNSPPLPNGILDVRGDGNCGYRAISLSLSGSEDNYRELRNLAARSLRRYRAQLREYLDEIIDEMIRLALGDGHGFEMELPHLEVISAAIAIPIYMYDESSCTGDVKKQPRSSGPEISADSKLAKVYSRNV